MITGATLETMKDLDHFLEYCTSHPEAQIIYLASNVQLMVDSYIAYLVALKVRSRVATITLEIKAKSYSTGKSMYWQKSSKL